jgi:hypothetical protein
MDEAELTTHFLEELSLMEKTMEDSKEMQKIFINRLRQFLQGEGPGSKSIRVLPFPAALFTRSGALIDASGKLLQCAGIDQAELSSGKINFLNRVVTENSGVLEAAVRVFAGETGVANDLVAPISMFIRDDNVPAFQCGYQTALFFPVRTDGAGTTCGAVVLLKQKVVIDSMEEKR